MCMQPAAWPEPDPQIAAAIAAKYRGKRPRPLAVLIRDHLGEWLRDEDFAAAFGDRGGPGWSPSRLALVTVLQRAENLTDRQAAEAVRTRIDWQYLLGLALDDPGFDHTVLSEFGTGWPKPGWSGWRWMRCWPGWPRTAWSRRAASSAPIPRDRRGGGRRQATAALAAAPRPGRGPGSRPDRRKDDPLPGRLRPPRRRRRHHALGRQPRRTSRPLPRPAQDPPRPLCCGRCLCSDNWVPGFIELIEGARNFFQRYDILPRRPALPPATTRAALPEISISVPVCLYLQSSKGSCWVNRLPVGRVLQSYAACL